MSELYINLPQLKKVPSELSGIPQDIRRKIQSLESIEQYVKSQISGGGELQRQIQSIREELERIASSMGSYGDALQQICGVYESCEEGIVKCGLSGYDNAKNSSGDDVPWYKTDTFKWVVGAAVVVGTVVAAAVVLTVAAPAILTAVVVGAAIGAATGAIAGGIIGGYKSVKNGGTFAEGAADGFFWGSIGGAVSGAVAGVATATGAGLLSMSAAQGIVSAGMYTAETSYDGGQVSAAGLALSFTTGAVVSAGSVVLAGKASQLLGKLSGVLKNGSSQTVSAAESAVDGAENAVKSGSKSTILSNEKAEEIAFDAIHGSNKADSVVLGKFDGGEPTAYTEVAKDIDAQYFQLDNWDELTNIYTEDEIWKINEKFLDIQTSSGREIYLSHNPEDFIGKGQFYSKELQYLIDNGYHFVEEGGIWHAIR